MQTLTEFTCSMEWGYWLTVVAALALVILTLAYLRFSAKVLAGQTDPCVILTVVHDENRPSVLQLVARNIGSGLAQDISFRFSRPIPAGAFGLTENDAREAAEMKDGPLIDGIPALGPGESRRIDWGQYGGLTVALAGQPVMAVCRFKKNGKYMPPVKCPLDIASFAGTIVVESPPAMVARELAKISVRLGHIATDIRQIRLEGLSLQAAKSETDAES